MQRRLAGYVFRIDLRSVLHQQLHTTKVFTFLFLNFIFFAVVFFLLYSMTLIVISAALYLLALLAPETMHY